MGSTRITRGAWRLIGSVVAAATIAALAWNAVEALASRPVHRSLGASAEGVERLVVRSEVADVNVVVRSDLDVVTAHGDLRVGIGEAPFAMRRVGDELRITATCRPVGGICVDRVTIAVPFDVDIAIMSTAGDIDIGLPASSDRPGVEFAVTTATDVGTTSARIRTDPRSPRSIEVVTDLGDITLAYRR